MTEEQDLEGEIGNKRRRLDDLEEAVKDEDNPQKLTELCEQYLEECRKREAEKEAGRNITTIWPALH